MVLLFISQFFTSSQTLAYGLLLAATACLEQAARGDTGGRDRDLRAGQVRLLRAAAADHQLWAEQLVVMGAYWRAG